MKELVTYLLMETSAVISIGAHLWCLSSRKYKEKKLGFYSYNAVHYPMEQLEIVSCRVKVFHYE